MPYMTGAKNNCLSESNRLTCILICVKRTDSWGWLDSLNDTAIRTQDSKFELLRSEVKYATSRSRRLLSILNLYKWAGEGSSNILLWIQEWWWGGPVSCRIQTFDILFCIKKSSIQMVNFMFRIILAPVGTYLM